MGLGACWVQVREISEDIDAEKTVKKALDIPERYRVLNMIAVGVPKRPKSPHTGDEVEKERLHPEEF